MTEHENITDIIITALKEMKDELQEDTLKDIQPNLQLYGLNGILDSMGLVRLISDVEDLISENFGKEIVIADERAMSLKFSPFRSIASLSAYVEQLIHEDR